MLAARELLTNKKLYANSESIKEKIQLEGGTTKAATLIESFKSPAF